LKKACGGDVDRDQEIARPVTRRGVALPLEPDLLACNKRRLES